MIETAHSLLPHQLAAINFSRTSSYFVCFAARRIGMTLAFAEDGVETSGRADSPENFTYVAPSEEGCREFMAYCSSIAVSTGRGTGHVDVCKNPGRAEVLKMSFPSGRVIVASPPEPDVFRGLFGRLVVDQAAWVDRLDTMLKPVLALIASGGGRLTLISNPPKDRTNPMLAVTEQIRSLGAPTLEGRFALSDAIEGGLYKTICRLSGIDWTPERQREWLANLRKVYGADAERELDLIF